ncbi:PxKF domain-containing protein [Planosporangium thailandense]|nr:PxKF domain-containing protein [Planosporangium thailandense]
MPLQLDDGKSTSPTGAPLTYSWDLPDAQNPNTDVRPTITLNQPGLYLVSLTVSDGARRSVPDWAVITVVERPIAEQGGTVNAGRAIPVVFTVKGEYGMDAFSAPPVSVPSRADGSSTGPAVPAETPGNSALTRSGTGRYQWVWKTDKAWAGTTRTLVLKLKDGTEHRVVYQFR